MKRVLIGTVLLFAALITGACAPRYRGYYGYDNYAYVNTAPPPPQYEYYGAPPAVGQVWIGGYWGWNNNRYLWNPGYWARPPRPRARWVAGYWGHAQRGYYYRPGYWR